MNWGRYLWNPCHWFFFWSLNQITLKEKVKLSRYEERCPNWPTTYRLFEFYKRNKLHFLLVYRRNNILGTLGEHEKSLKISHHAGKACYTMASFPRQVLRAPECERQGILTSVAFLSLFVVSSVTIVQPSQNRDHLAHTTSCQVFCVDTYIPSSFAKLEMNFPLI